MPFVVKTNPDSGAHHDLRDVVKFEVTTYEEAWPEVGDQVAWFTSEQYGGTGLHAIGEVVAGSKEHGRAPNGRRMVSFLAKFDKSGPSKPLGKADFAPLDRRASNTAEERIGRVLYRDSLTKVAAVDQDAFDSLVERFN